MALYVPLLTTAQSFRVARLYLAGHTIKQLREAFNCSSTAIRTALRKQGVTIRPKGGSKRKNPIVARGPIGRPPALDAEQAAEAEDLYVVEKWSRTRLARYFKTSDTAITTALTSRGITLRTRGQAAIESNKAGLGRHRRQPVASVFHLGAAA